MKRVLGIDPGLASTGYGCIERQGNSLRTLAFGVIKTPPHLDTGARLLNLYGKIGEVLDENSPDEVALERLFFARNASSALPVAQARGVILLAIAQRGLPVGDYPPQMVKQAVVGNGQASKEQVQEMVRVILGAVDVARPDHAADALATAITHIHSGVPGVQ